MSDWVPMPVLDVPWRWVYEPSMDDGCLRIIFNEPAHR